MPRPARYIAGTVLRWALLVVLSTGCARVLGLTAVDPPPLCLADDFESDALSPATWSVIDPSAPTTVQDTGGELAIAIAPMTKTVNGIRSVASFDLTGGEARTELVAPPFAVAGVTAGMFVFLDDLNYYVIEVENGTMMLRTLTQNAPDELVVSFDAVADRFWRIRHDSATDQISFETGPDPSSWVVKRTVPVTVPLAELRAQYLGGSYKATIAAPGTAQFDNFQVILPGCRP